MIYSMTGFGSGRVEAANLTVVVEAKTVNHRYLDIHVRLSSEFQSLEGIVRKAVSDTLRRGRVDLFVKIELKRDEIRMKANPTLIASYVQLIDELRADFPIQGELTLESISKLPGAITVSNDRLDAEEIGLVSYHLKEAALAALKQVKEMRMREGAALVQDLDDRIDKIHTNLETIENGADSLLQHYRESLLTRLAELAPDLKVDSNRLEVEALIYAEKSDIAEETTRLKSHLNQFGELKTRSEETGKRMDFLLQEMNREVTTILAKTSGLNHTGTRIGEAAIEIKVEIDKLREQVQNIE